MAMVHVKQSDTAEEFGQLGTYSPIILQNAFCLARQILLYYEVFESIIISDWLNHTVKPIRSCVTFKFTKYWRKEKYVLEEGW